MITGMTKNNNRTESKRPAISRFLLFVLSAILFALAAAVVGQAMPGAETAEEAQEMMAGQSTEGMDEMMAEAIAEETAQRTEAAAAAVAERGAAPLQSMWVVLFDDADQDRTTVSVQGVIDPYTPLPAKVMFYFADDYVLESLTQVDFDTGEERGELNYEVGPSGLEAFENLSVYTFTLTDGHVFNAGFSLPVPLFDFEGQMGDSPLASFNFVPPNDLKGLVVGFVAPSEDRVGAGNDVILVGETDEGEVYGIIRENVDGGVLQEYTIAFGSRASRDAALAEADAAALAASLETTPTVFDWFTTPTGMIVTGSILILLIAAAVITVLILRQKNAAAEDDNLWDDDFTGSELEDALDEEDVDAEQE